MKKSLILVIVLLTAIIIMASFGLSLDPTPAIHLPKSVSGRALFVCPTEHSFWDSMSRGLTPYFKYIGIIFFFGGIVLLFSWGWAMYQNLLKDTFEEKAFKNPWAFTKLIFWAFIIVLLLVHTPNRYREVKVENSSKNWVLCEANSAGAKPVYADTIRAK